MSAVNYLYRSIPGRPGTIAAPQSRSDSARLLKARPESSTVPVMPGHGLSLAASVRTDFLSDPGTGLSVGVITTFPIMHPQPRVKHYRAIKTEYRAVSIGLIGSQIRS